MTGIRLCHGPPSWITSLNIVHEVEATRGKFTNKMATSSDSVELEFWHKNITKIPKVTNSFVEDFAEKNLPIKATVTRGYKFFHEEYIHDIEVKLCKEEDSGVVARAKCFRSMKKNEDPHKLSVVFESSSIEASINKYMCSCAAGQGLCHHVLGLLYTLAHFQLLGLKSVPPMVSKTSKAQRWHIPSRKEGIKARPVTDLIIQKSKPKDKLHEPKKKRKVCGVASTIYKPFQQSLSSLDLTSVLSPQFENLNNQPGFMRIWEDEQSEPPILVDSAFGKVPKGCVISYQQPLKVKSNINIQLPAFNFPSLSYPDTVLNEKQDLFFSSLAISGQQSIDFEMETREQSTTTAWHELRKFRLTASNFKDICSRRKDHEILSTRLLKGKVIQTAAMKYGIQNEGVAADMYKTQFGRDTHLVGFLINPCLPHLGCSPDRRVFDDTEQHPWGLIEIKCSPASHLDNLQYLKFNERNGSYSLKKTHKYYYQVMGCLGLTGSQWCDFFVYCKDEFHCERVYFDELLFSEMLDKLNLFFFDYHLNTCVQ